MRSKAVIYWLTPAKPEYDLFRDFIRILAKQFHAPEFAPHLTLCVEHGGRSPRTVMNQIRSRPIRLRVGAIGLSAKFTKTLFVRVKSSPRLEKLVTDLGGSPKSSRDPHISLIYRKLPPRIKRELAVAIELPFREILFDSIKAVRCIVPSRTRGDVESWRILATRKLR
jgi:hypothetical protein